MSLPDHMLQLPDEARVCAEHDESYPCSACRADEADRQYDAQREERT
jgi:hypothetical protein